MVNFARLILKLGSSVAGFFGRFLGAEGLRRLRNKKRSIKRKIYPRENLNSYIQSQIRILERAAKGSMNILRPLSPHLPIYKPQLISTFPISHRISKAFLATIVLFFYLLCVKIGLICFTYKNFYQFLFFSSKLILVSFEITTLALFCHFFNGVHHLLTYFLGFIFLRIGRKRLK